MDIQKAPNINTLWGDLIIEEFIRNGVDYFCIAPGSRSAPLTAAVALNKNAKSFIHFDERGLAFHALGYVSATRRPAALICTSGTAAANFFPAIIETSKKKLPLIVLTSDRPPELQKSGSDQTIDQVGLYGKYAKWDFTFPCPTRDIKPEFVLTTIDQAVYQSRSGIPGVVHLNCMYREPLAPVGKGGDFSSYAKSLKRWINSDEPYTTYFFPSGLAKSFDPQVLKSLDEIKNGLIVVGRLSSQEEQGAVLRLSEKIGWPIFPDITSGLRLGNNHSHVIHYFDQILLSSKALERLKIDGVLHLGGRVSSKRYYQFIDKVQPRHYISVLSHPLRNDPLHILTLRIQSPIKDFCEFVVSSINRRKSTERLDRFKKLNDSVDTNIDQFVNKANVLTEIAVSRLISENIPKGSALFLASSMPIRDMDMFAAHDHSPVIIGSNRGASGIDGTIATAIGFARGLNKPATLVIGDLAALHDLNSLGMARELTKPFIVVIVNNNGGGIFNFLPVFERQDIFEKYFSTPHHLSFSSAAKLFGLNYAAPASTRNFRERYKIALTNKRPTIIEVKSNRSLNLKTHQQLQKKILA